MTRISRVHSTLLHAVAIPMMLVACDGAKDASDNSSAGMDGQVAGGGSSGSPGMMAGAEQLPAAGTVGASGGSADPAGGDQPSPAAGDDATGAGDNAAMGLDNSPMPDNGNPGAGDSPEPAAAPDGTDTEEVLSDPCATELSATISDAIQTVGIITFGSATSGVTEARIEFGLDDAYGMVAPVDLNEVDYRTLLLGMKQDRDYHFRITIVGADGECVGADHTIRTGFLPNVLPQLTVTNYDYEALAGGFLMTGQYEARGGDSSPAYIIDQDGDYVWAVLVGDYVTGVRMSYDGKYMWINGTDNTTNGVANIHRVTMDGLVDEDLSAEFGLQDHSITVLPEETVVFYGHDETRCANIRQRFADGTIVPIINSGDAHGASGQCHVNHIEYSPEDDDLIFSDDLHNNYTKITRDGQVLWVLGGETNMFTGDGSEWTREHGLNVISPTRFVYFTNGAMNDPIGSVVHEVQLDLEAMTATRVWTYQPAERIANEVLGDVQRLANGNTVVGFSAQGILHEVDMDKNLLQEITWPLGGAFGYIVKRPTLYGPPPR